MADSGKLFSATTRACLLRLRSRASRVQVRLRLRVRDRLAQPCSATALFDCRGDLAYTCVPRRLGTYFYVGCLVDSGKSNRVNVVHTFLEHALSHNHLSHTTRATSGSLMTTTSEAPSLARLPPLPRHVAVRHGHCRLSIHIFDTFHTVIHVQNYRTNQS